MIDYVLNFKFNTLLALYLYWIPLALCLIGYSVRSINNYRNELARRDECIRTGYGYFPTLTLGTLVGRVFCSVIPGLNLVSLVFSVGGPMLSEICRFFSDILNIPLVHPHNKK